MTAAPHDRAAGQEADPKPAQPAAASDDDADDLYDDGASPFPHPPWTVGLVLVAGAITLLFGLLVHPVWLLVGSPFVLALGLWLYIRLFARQ